MQTIDSTIQQLLVSFSVVMLIACARPADPDPRAPTPADTSESENPAQARESENPAQAAGQADGHPLWQRAKDATADPDDPRTWIPRLEDRDQIREAVARLRRLTHAPGIEAAIEPLAAAWEAHDRPKIILSVLIDIAERGAGGPHWKRAHPVLVKAVNELDIGDQKSIESALIAADALGKSGAAESVPALVGVLERPMPKLSPGQRVRLAAISALGRLGHDPRARAALIRVLSAEPRNQPPQLFAAAALALADAPSPDAIEPLLLAMYRIAPIYPQCRRALIAIGLPARDQLIQVLQRQHQALEELARDDAYDTDCDRAMGPDTRCRAPSNLEYKAALLLGDFYSSTPVAPLLRALEKPARPSFYMQDIPGPSQHTAILDALKKIGDPSAASRVWAYATGRTIADEIKPLAVDTYSFLATDTSELQQLARIFKNGDADDPLRVAAGMAYGRLARSKRHLAPLAFMVESYRRQAERLARKADDSQTGRSMVARDFQRMHQQNLARAHVGIRCQKDPACYMRVLEETPEEFAQAMGNTHIRDFSAGREEDKKDLKLAGDERALLEVRKMGSAAGAVTDDLLRHVDSTSRITRQGVLLALTKVAPLPCDRCVERLGEVIEAQRDESTLHALTVDTQAVLMYFRWAGRP